MHKNLVANTIQSTFLLYDRMNDAMQDGKKFSADKKSGWYEAAEKHGSGREVKPAGQRGDTAAPPTTEKQRYGKDIVDERPKGQKEFHIDVLPQFHCYGLLVNLVAIHTVSGLFQIKMKS